MAQKPSFFDQLLSAVGITPKKWKDMTTADPDMTPREAGWEMAKTVDKQLGHFRDDVMEEEFGPQPEEMIRENAFAVDQVKNLVYGDFNKMQSDMEKEEERKKAVHEARPGLIEEHVQQWQEVTKAIKDLPAARTK